MSEQVPRPRLPSCRAAARPWGARPREARRASGRSRPTRSGLGMLAHLLSFVAAYIALGSWPR